MSVGGVVRGGEDRERGARERINLNERQDVLFGVVWY